MYYFLVVILHPCRYFNYCFDSLAMQIRVRRRRYRSESDAAEFGEMGVSAIEDVLMLEMS